MNASELRALIRDVLRSELDGMRAAPAAPARVERVSIASDAELMRFVQRLLQLAGDAQARAALESGQHVFALASGTAPVAPPQRAAPVRARTPAFANGLVNERQVEALADGIAEIEVARSVRFTPLALDRLRQRGIKLKRVKS